MNGDTQIVQQPAAGRPWAPALRWSVPWHGAMALGWALAPAAWPWWLAGLAGNHLLLTGAGLVPRSTLLGPNIRQLPEAARALQMVSLTFDDGPDPQVTPRVLELLAQARVRCSFFCIGARLMAHPDLARAIVAAGHTIENHTRSHGHRFSFLGPGGLRAEIQAAQADVLSLTGQAPRFFRAPAGLRNPLLEPVLADLGLHLTSWTRRGFDTVNGDAERVYRRLDRGLAAGDILLLHDGHAARGATGRPVVLEVLPRLLDRLEARRLLPVTLPQAFAA